MRLTGVKARSTSVDAQWGPELESFATAVAIEIIGRH
jgi:hypothetical protein